MRDSVLTADEFGPFHNSTYTLQPGMTQSMQFKDSDIGPCYMSVEERQKQKLDIHSGKTRDKDLNKNCLIQNLKTAGIINPTGTKKFLQEQSICLGLPIKSTNEVVNEGWAGQQKGALQLLFERGWIDPSQIQHYTSDGKKAYSPLPTDSNTEPVDPTGCNFSIKALLLLQADFVNELTLLQFHGSRLGAIIDRSPKCHPEIAGEGIEYAWALSKFFIEGPLSLKNKQRQNSRSW